VADQRLVELGVLPIPPWAVCRQVSGRSAASAARCRYAARTCVAASDAADGIQLGAVRISLGSAIAQAAYAVGGRAATGLLTSGTYDSVADGITLRHDERCRHSRALKAGYGPGVVAR
jgi:hypothetical protein